ncbi:MAG: topoisomerase DNA-binding C4 zinc finger domain-containing protein [Candidatus Doudnabacteria bacterium]|jgi:hypothetical protein
MPSNFLNDIVWTILKTYWPWLVLIVALRVVADLTPDFIAYLKRKNKFKTGGKWQQKNTSSSESDKFCPKCGGDLVFRNGKFGQFTGCSNYPKCRYTQ